MVIVRVAGVVHDRVSRERGTWPTERSLANDGFVDELGAGDVLRKLAGSFTRPAGASMAFEPEEGVARHFSFVGEYPYHAPRVNDIPAVRRIDVLEDMPEELGHRFGRSSMHDLGLGVVDGTGHDRPPEGCQAVRPEPLPKERSDSYNVMLGGWGIPVFTAVCCAVTRRRAGAVRAGVEGAADSGVVVINGNVGAKGTGGILREDACEVRGGEHGELGCHDQGRTVTWVSRVKGACRS